MSFRVGNGFDAHKLVAGRPLVLGGVSVPYDRGLEGHSDGDCLIHALCDALLGAAAAGDMGRYFPSVDPRFKGAPSLHFLEEVMELVRRRGFVVENVDVTVIAQQPRLGTLTEGMRMTLARYMGVEPDRVSIKVKSTDGLGAIGRGEGIAAHASALLRTRP